jgi:hypothetical protein
MAEALAYPDATARTKTEADPYGMTNKERTTARAKAKCGGLSTPAAKAPPSVEMTFVLGGDENYDNFRLLGL